MRIVSLVTELRTVFGREILDEDLNSAFFKELPDVGKLQFLTLQNTSAFQNSLHELCLEVKLSEAKISWRIFPN